MTSLIVMSTLFVMNNIAADVLELKNGSVFNGNYKGGTQGTVRFQVSGEIKVISIKDIIALTFTGDSATNTTAAPMSKVVAAKAPPVNTSSSVPASTVMFVRTTQEIGTHNMSEGNKFTVSLETKLMAGNVQIAPAGSTIYGRVIKSEKGGIGARKAILELTLTEIKIDGQLHKIKTNVFVGEGKSGGLGRKILKGAAVGALADGSSGADTGARIGAGVGILSGGRHAGLRSGSVIEFTLADELSI